MRYIIIVLSLVTICNVQAQEFDFTNLHTSASVDGKQAWIKCPNWDWDLVPIECRMPGFNCIPVCGKYQGDKVDIGAYQYFTGITSEKPWGDWDGIPLPYSILIDPVQNLKRKE